MVITQTPFRISFFGGGTDFEGFYRKHGGSVLSTTFDKYCYVTASHLPRFFDHSNSIVYSKIERTNCVEEIKHPAVRNAMKYLDMHELRLAYDADLPARSGLGTSSSFAVGMLNAFYAIKGKRVDKHTLADDAIYLERTLCQESGGIQDQIAASYGGLNRIDMNADGYTVTPIIIQKERRQMLNDHLMLFFTGISRFSSDIARAQEASVQDKTAELLEMLQLVDAAESVLTTGSDLDEFGRLLDYAWKLKRGITNEISTSSIDRMYERAVGAGAVGGKLLGAGGGGFLLFYAQPDKQPKVKEALDDMLYVPFSFENSGTRVLYYQDEFFDIQEYKNSGRVM